MKKKLTNLKKWVRSRIANFGHWLIRLAKHDNILKPTTTSKYLSYGCCDGQIVKIGCAMRVNADMICNHAERVISECRNSEDAYAMAEGFLLMSTKDNIRKSILKRIEEDMDKFVVFYKTEDYMGNTCISGELHIGEILRKNIYGDDTTIMD